MKFLFYLFFSLNFYSFFSFNHKKILKSLATDYVLPTIYGLLWSKNAHYQSTINQNFLNSLVKTMSLVVFFYILNFIPTNSNKTLKKILYEPIHSNKKYIISLLIRQITTFFLVGLPLQIWGWPKYQKIKKELKNAKLFQSQINDKSLKKIKSDEIDLGLNINSVSKKKKINIIFNFKDKELKFADETLTKQFMVSILNNKKIFDTNMTDLNDTNMTDPIFWDYKEFNRKLIELIGQNAALINKNDNFDEKFKKKEEDNKKYILRFSCNCNENNKSFKEEILTKILNFLSNKNNYLLYERNLDRLQTIYPKNKIFSTFTIEITFTQN